MKNRNTIFLLCSLTIVWLLMLFAILIYSFPKVHIGNDKMAARIALGAFASVIWAFTMYGILETQ